MEIHTNFPQAPRNRTVALSGPLRFPSITPLAALTVRSKALEFGLRDMPPSSPASLAQLCEALSAPTWQDDGAYPGLRDELEAYLDEPSRPDRSTEAAKIRAEFAVYARVMERLPEVAAIDCDTFTALVVEIHRRLGAGRNSLRTGPVRIRSDAGGNTVLFPDHRLCPTLLGNLHGFLVQNLDAAPALCATASYAAIIHAHPFNDGNGRTARTLYNLILAAGTGTRHFVPIQLIAALHRGSLLIKLRRALYGGDWEGLQAFFADAVRLSIRHQTRPRRAHKTTEEPQPNETRDTMS